MSPTRRPRFSEPSGTCAWRAVGALRSRCLDGYTTVLVVLSGAVRGNGSEPIRAAEVGLFDRAGERIDINCEENAIALLLSGEPIDEPIVGQGREGPLLALLGKSDEGVAAVTRQTAKIAGAEGERLEAPRRAVDPAELTGPRIGCSNGARTRRGVETRIQILLARRRRLCNAGRAIDDAVRTGGDVARALTRYVGNHGGSRIGERAGRVAKSITVRGRKR